MMGDNQPARDKLAMTLGWWWLILSAAIVGLGWTLSMLALSWYVYHVSVDLAQIGRRLRIPLRRLVIRGVKTSNRYVSRIKHRFTPPQTPKIIPPT